MESADKDAMNRFLAENPELEVLSARLATFNIFRALKVERVEIRHSNTLGWLLDPAESHGLGDVFLRRILSNILLDADIQGLTAADVELKDFDDIEVRREWRHIDVLVIDRGNKLVLLIENKVGSGEMAGQLARYRAIVNQEFPSFTLVPVFLTLDGTPSDDEDEAARYVSYSYLQLTDVLKRIIEPRRSQMPEAVATFLDHYMETLGRITMQDTALVELCRTIYRKHKRAIDLIFEHGMVSSFEKSVKTTLPTLGEFEILYTRPNWVTFIPKSWADVLPQNGTAWRFDRKFSVACWFARKPESVKFAFELSRMDDPQLRLTLVKALQDAGFRFTKKAFDTDATYSRFYASTHTLAGADDEVEVQDAVQKLMANAKAAFTKAEAVFKDVFPSQGTA